METASLIWISSSQKNILRFHVEFQECRRWSTLFDKRFYRDEDITLPETNIAPTNGWLEYYFPIGEAYFQRLR